MPEPAQPSPPAGANFDVPPDALGEPPPYDCPRCRHMEGWIEVDGDLRPCPACSHRRHGAAHEPGSPQQARDWNGELRRLQDQVDALRAAVEILLRREQSAPRTDDLDEVLEAIRAR